MTRRERFLQLTPQEEIRLMVRRSFRSFLGTLFFSLLFVFTPLFFLIPLFFLGVWGIAIFGASVFIGMLLLGSVLWKIYRNYVVVTNLHLIDVDRRRFLESRVVKYKLSDISELREKKKGARQRCLGYGSLSFRLASSGVALAIRNITDPERVKMCVEEALTAPISAQDGVIDDERLELETRLTDVLEQFRAHFGKERFKEILFSFFEDEEEEKNDQPRQ